MFKKLSILLVVASLLLMVLPVTVSAQGPETRYLVVFRGNKLPKDAADLVAAAGGQLVDTIPQVNIGFAVSNDPNFGDNLRGQAHIGAVGAEQYQMLPSTDLPIIAEYTDDILPEGLSAPTGTDAYYEIFQWDIRRVHAPEAWANGVTGSHDTVVAVLDSGIAWNHPDLAPNVVYHTCYATTPDCVDYPGYSYHGTHVAGSVAAAFDGGGAVGVGPNLGLASYNVFEVSPDGFVAFDGPIFMAMIDAAEQGFDVINMSLGGYIVRSDGADAQAAIQAWNRVVNYVIREGVTVIASSGNDEVDLNGPVFHIPSDLPGVVGVGATGIGPDWAYPQEGAYDVRAFYSNYGAPVRVAAPGGDLGPEGTVYPYPAVYYLIMSTYVVADPVCAETASCPVGYAWAGGTSMAAPHVAGVAGLIADENPRANPHQIASILTRTAENLGDRQAFGHGMVNAYEATR